MDHAKYTFVGFVTGSVIVVTLYLLTFVPYITDIFMWLIIAGLIGVGAYGLGRIMIGPENDEDSHGV